MDLPLDYRFIYSPDTRRMIRKWDLMANVKHLYLFSMLRVDLSWDFSHIIELISNSLALVFPYLYVSYFKVMILAVISNASTIELVAFRKK